MRVEGVMALGRGCLPVDGGWGSMDWIVPWTFGIFFGVLSCECWYAFVALCVHHKCLNRRPGLLRHARDAVLPLGAHWRRAVREVGRPGVHLHLQPGPQPYGLGCRPGSLSCFLKLMLRVSHSFIGRTFGQLMHFS